MRTKTRRIIGLFGTFAGFFSYAALAAGEGAARQTISLSEIIETGGWAMKVIAGLSVFGVFLIFFFLFTLRAGVLFPKRFLQEAEDAAAEGDIEALLVICRDNGSAAAAIIGAAAECIGNDAKASYMVVRDAIEDEGARQAGNLWTRLQLMMDVAVIAPMLGLLGTVLGMMQSFSGLQSGVSIINKADALAAGVSKAMYTTAAGLFVGIIAMMVYAFFRGRANNLIGGLESCCNRVLRRYVARQSGKF